MASYIIRHVTTYRYRRAVAFGEHRLMLRPRDSHDQRTRRMDVTIEPPPRALGWSEDAAGNLAGSALFGQRAEVLRFTCEFEVEQDARAPDPTAIAEHARTLPVSYGAEETGDLARFIERQHPDPEHKLHRWVRGIMAQRGPRAEPEVDTWSFLQRVNTAIRHDFAYLRRDAKGIQSPSETLRLGRGTCRDFAVLMCEAVRSQGLAARFVSGYLHVRESEPGTVSAGGATHAWLQVYLPGAGWIDFDPTSGTIGSAGLIRVALVRDPERACPVSGTFTGFPSDDLGMTVDVQVTAVADGTGLPARTYAFG